MIVFLSFEGSTTRFVLLRFLCSSKCEIENIFLETAQEDGRQESLMLSGQLVLAVKRLGLQQEMKTVFFRARHEFVHRHTNHIFQFNDFFQITVSLTTGR